MTRTVGFGMLIGGLAVIAAGAASADEAIIKYRESVYEALGGHTSALAGIVKGDVPFAGDAKAHAKAIGVLAPMVKHIFPEGSGEGDTEALPVIWEKPAEFAKAQDNFIAAATRLAAVADDNNGKALAAALGEMAKTCKACHDEFRKKK